MRALLLSLGFTHWFDAKDLDPDAALFQRAASVPAYNPRMHPVDVRTEHPEAIQ